MIESNHNRVTWVNSSHRLKPDWTPDSGLYSGLWTLDSELYFINVLYRKMWRDGGGVGVRGGAVAIGRYGIYVFPLISTTFFPFLADFPSFFSISLQTCCFKVIQAVSRAHLLLPWLKVEWREVVMSSLLVRCWKCQNWNLFTLEDPAHSERISANLQR